MGTKRRPAQLSDVARWHQLSGLPENVTGDGEVVDAGPGRQLASEKAVLRAEIESLRNIRQPGPVQGLARLAAGYLLAGDVETARRYLAAAQDRLREL